MTDSFFPSMDENPGIDRDIVSDDESPDLDSTPEHDDRTEEAAGRYAPDANAPDDDAMTDDDALTADDAVSTGETHADDLDRGPDGVAPR